MIKLEVVMFSISEEEENNNTVGLWKSSCVFTRVYYVLVSRIVLMKDEQGFITDTSISI